MHTGSFAVGTVEVCWSFLWPDRKLQFGIRLHAKDGDVRDRFAEIQSALERLLGTSLVVQLVVQAGGREERAVFLMVPTQLSETTAVEMTRRLERVTRASQ